MRTPQFRYGVHPDWSTPSSLYIGIGRVDGNPPRDRFGQRMYQDGLTLDEAVAELRELLGRLKAPDEPVAPPPEPVSWPVVDGRIIPPAILEDRE